MRAREIEPKKLVVFDIDDTLVHTQTKVHVVKDGQIVKSLNSHDFTHYKLQPGESFDFEDFRNAREFFEKSKPIIPMMNQLKRDIATGNKVVMVTARADFDDKELFLDTFRKYGVDTNKLHVYRAGNSKEGTTEERKKKIIKLLLDRDEYTKAIMYDDALPNLHSFIELKKEHPKTRFYAWHVSKEGEASEYMREGFIAEKKRKRRNKYGVPAYGPGPYGWYGYDAGYSGDSGGDGGGVGEDQHPNEPPLGPEFKPTMPKGTVRVDVSDVYDWYKLGMHIANLKGLGKHDFGKGPPSTILSFGSEEEEHEFIQALNQIGLDITDIDPAYHDKKGGVKTDPTYNVENIVTELKITDKDVQRIIKDKLAIDADSGVEAMRLAIEKMSSLPNTSYVRSQSSQLMMLYKRAKMSIGGDYYRKLNKLAENFADGKNPQDKGDSKRHGIPKNATIAQLKKIRSSSTASPRKKQLAHWQINMRQGRKKK